MSDWKSIYDKVKKKLKSDDDATPTVEKTTTPQKGGSSLSFSDFGFKDFDFASALDKTVSTMESRQKKTTQDVKSAWQKFNSDLAPIAERRKEERKQKEQSEKEAKWFKKGAMEDGFSWKGLGKNAVGTLHDVNENVTEAVFDATENLIDTTAFGLAGIGILNKENTGEFIAKELLNPELKGKTDAIGNPIRLSDKVAQFGNPTGWLNMAVNQGETEANSFLGNPMDSMVQSTAHMAGSKALERLGVPGWLTQGVNAFGSEIEQAFKNDATFKQAGISGAISAVSEVVFERLSSGVKFKGASLDDGLQTLLKTGIENKFARTLAKFGLDSLGEGLEEVLTEATSAIARKFTYLKDEEWNEVLSKESLFDAFISGVFMNAVFGTANAAKSVATGRDYTSGLTANEEKVVNKLYEDEVAKRKAEGDLKVGDKTKIYDKLVQDMQKGYIDTDAIEEVLGGDSYKEYKGVVDNENNLKKEVDELIKESDKYEDIPTNQLTGRQQMRRDYLRDLIPELQNQIRNNENSTTRKDLKSKLETEVMNMVRGDRLSESYAEKARVYQKLDIDTETFSKAKHADAAKQTVASAVELGANNTNRVRDLVENSARIAGKTGKAFIFKDGETVKNSFIERQTKKIQEYENMDNLTRKQQKALAKMKQKLDDVKSGKIIVNGEYSADGIVLNIDSKNPLMVTVGHEVTHGTEKTKTYGKMKEALFAYAKTKGVDVDTLIEMSKMTYEGITDAVAEQEVVADLVGEMLFTDDAFVEHLARTDTNVFQNLWNDIKNLVKMATPGSKEAKELANLEHKFEKAFREANKAQKNTTEDGGGQYSLKVEYADGTIDELTDLRSLTDEQIVGYLEAVKAFELIDETYIPVRRELPQVIIDSLAEKGISVENRSLVMEAFKARKLMRNNLGNGRKGHGLKPQQIVDIIADIENPVKIIYQTNRVDQNGEPIEDNVAIFVRYSRNGVNGFATVEFTNPERTDVIGKEFGDTNFYTANTAFFPDTEKNGKPYNYMKVLENNPNNFVVEIKRRQSEDSANWTKHPSTTNELPSSVTKVTQEEPTVKKQFSLSSAVEKTKNLVALHNLSEDKLFKSLELGGLPMPSIAITKSDIPHSNFGEITLIFGRETIDPKVNKKNKTYSADAWTPVFPRVEYEENSEVANKVSRKLHGLYNKVDDTFRIELGLVSSGFEHYLNRNGGEEGLIERVKDNYGLKAAFLEEQGKHIDKVTTTKEVEKGYNPANADKYQKVADILGVTTKDEIGKLPFKAVTDAQKAELEKIYPGISSTTYRMSRIFGMVGAYLDGQNSETKYETVTDYEATNKAVDDALDVEAYDAWVRNLFAGIEKSSGIYNNKDIFTPSGNRRTFAQTHLPVTLENIVKAMATQNGGNTKNVSGFNGIKTLRAATAETFKSVDEMHKREGRLQNLSEEQLEEVQNELQTRLYNIIDTIDKESGRSGYDNEFMRFDTIGNILTEIGESGKYNVADIQKVLKEYGRDVSDDTAMQVKQLLYDVTQMPVNIFEAKPARVVGFDEAKVFVIPNNADPKLKQELLNRGYSIAEYDPDVEGNRQKVVNQFEEYRFSLSDANAQPTANGLTGRDILTKQAPVQAPANYDVMGATPETNIESRIRPNVVEEAPVAPIPVESAPVAPMDDVAPVAENATTEDIAPMPAVDTRREVYAEPDDIAPIDGKRRKWIGTSTESEVVDGQILPDDLDQELIHYQPISNKKTLGNANSMLDSMGYESSVSYMNQRFASSKVSLDDIALGERLIQEAVKRGDTETAKDLIMDISILGTELGQKVQALSIIKRLTPEGQLKMLMRTVERGKAKNDKAFEGVEVTNEMAKEILDTRNADGTYDQDKLNAAVENVKQKIAKEMKSTILERINEWRYLSMLGNPKTHIRNLVSNVAMYGTRQFKNAIARTGETLAGNKIERTKTWQRASKEVRDFAKQAASQEYGTDKTSKYSEAGDLKSRRQVLKIKALDAASKANSAALSAEDTWFSKPAYRQALQEYLTANGIRTEEDIQKNGKLIAQAKQYAKLQAQEATFQQDSYIANKIAEIERKNAVTNVLIGSVMPFKKTPINIAKAGLSYSPLGFARNVYDAIKVSKGEMNASTAIDHFAQTLTGTSLAVLGYVLASRGILNGAGKDDKEGKYDYQLGKQSYSFNFDGDSFSLSWLSPVAMPLFVGANAYEILVEDKDWNYNVLGEALAQTLDPMNEMSFLSSLTDVLSSYDSGMAAFGGMLESAAQSYITSFVPTLSSQIAQVTDDKKRSTKIDANSGQDFLDETWNQIKYKIPGLRQTLEPSTDIWGNEIPLSENAVTKALETFILPYSRKDNIATKVDEEIKEVYRLTGENGVIPNVPYNYINYKNEKYEMTAAEHTEFKKMYGQTAYNLMEDLIYTDTYRRASAEDKAKMMDDIFTYAMDEAKREFFDGRDVEYANTTEDNVPVYKENAIKGAIDNDMTVEEFKLYRDNPEKAEIARAIGGFDVYSKYQKDTTGMSLSEKADYVGKMKGLSVKQKNLLINSETDRKEPIDLTGYEKFKNFEQFEYAKKNPTQYAVSKAISKDFSKFYGIHTEVERIKAENDSSSGTKDKDVVRQYIFSLDLDEGQKALLYRSLYSSKSDKSKYNRLIVEYLDNRDDISWAEMEEILIALDFTITDGNRIKW